MPAKDLGTRLVCFKCGTKFYDLRKPDPLCPKCGTDQRDSPALRSPAENRRARLATPKAPEPVEAAEEAEAPEEAIEEEEFEGEEADLPADDDV